MERQCGITLDAEIGLYVRDFDSKLPKGFYRSATDCEGLYIIFNLFHKCYLFSRKDFTWRLTGFDIGHFSKPKNLKMIISIQFPNQEMRTDFITGLLRAGYSENKIKISCNEVTFEYCCPLNYKLNNCRKIVKCIAQISNFINCSIYMHVTRLFNRTIDKLDYLRYLASCLYKFIFCRCVPKRQYKKRKKYKVVKVKINE